ncbi:hypothetical protein [Actinocorallia herbida]|uniref:hypothetical protein n=1 Tax=Actinocorallia herbida TaxID=58109 RepID=UPI001B868BC7|nr:hypothetical protein [Actinocorallia herbida]
MRKKRAPGTAQPIALVRVGPSGDAVAMNIRQTEAGPAAQHFVMLRDGATAAGCLFDPVRIGDTFLRGVEGLVRTHAARRPS